jgi:hypothetical protein
MRHAVNNDTSTESETGTMRMRLMAAAWREERKMRKSGSMSLIPDSLLSPAKQWAALFVTGCSITTKMMMMANSNKHQVIAGPLLVVHASTTTRSVMHGERRG